MPFSFVLRRRCGARFLSSMRLSFVLAALVPAALGLAAAAGLSPSTISKIEQGRKNVRADTLRAVAQALERSGVDLTQNTRTGHHAVGTSYA